MRILLIGQAAFAERVLEGLREAGHDIAAAYCPPDSAGAKPDPFAARAQVLGVPVHRHRSMRGDEVAAEVAGYAADLGVLAYVTQIVPPAVFDAPRLGSICFHPSLLPRYRGGSAIPWQLIRGETRTGVTMFWVDPGIDTGPILLQREAAIRPDDTAASLYYDVLFPLGVQTVIDAVGLVAGGSPPRQVQDESRATYDPLCRDEHAAIDWQRPVAEVHNLIRGCDPQPGAYVTRGGEPIRCHDARRGEAASGSPGTITAVGPEGIVVAGSGGSVRIGRLRVGAKKLPAAEAAATLGLQVGDRLGDA